MERKEIQTQRMKGYFVQATKEILKGEGLRGISVRNVAEQAGYSYATLYNYFRDIKELIFVCVQDFQDECKEGIRVETKDYPNGIEKLKSIIKSYTKYFIQYPGIFELFFLESVSDISDKNSNIKLIVTFLDSLCSEDWNHCITMKILNKEEVDILKDQINYMITGLLLFYLNRRYPDTYESFMNIIDSQLNFILEKYDA
jgi:AcrR family transcriptional regulator